jgi:large subunit ribosomal protein L29
MAKKKSTKNPTEAEDFRTQTADELGSTLAKLKKEQFNLRFQRANGQLENTGRVRSLRKEIARLETVMTEKRASASAKA